MISLPNLAIDFGAGGPDDEVMLTQEFGGNEYMVTLHPSQVRLIAERMGLTSAPDADARRTIARLSRHLRLLYDRINELDDRLRDAERLGHQDLEHECAFSLSTWEMATEFVRDLDAIDEAHPKAGPLNTPENGAASLASARVQHASVTHGESRNLVPPFPKLNGAPGCSPATPAAPTVAAASTSQSELPLAPAADPMANGCTTDGKPMADAMGNGSAHEHTAREEPGSPHERRTAADASAHPGAGRIASAAPVGPAVIHPTATSQQSERSSHAA